jgi:A nuclease of the HNH/ENDO VII superfamily with conserved LHH
LDPLGLDVGVDTHIYYSGGKRYMHATFKVNRTGADAVPLVGWMADVVGGLTGEEIKDTETFEMDFLYPCDPRLARSIWSIWSIIGQTKNDLETIAAMGGLADKLQGVVDNSLALVQIVGLAVPGSGMVGNAIADAAIAGLNGLAEGKDAAGILADAAAAGAESALNRKADAIVGVFGGKAGKKATKDTLQGPPTKRGNAPIGSDGNQVELRHRGQKPDSPLDEMTRSEHRGPGNFKKNHENTGQHPSEIDRDAWNTQRRQYWRDEADSGRFDDMQPGGG